MIKKFEDSGAKAYQRSDNEDRSAEYKLWHRKLSRSCSALDVDFIEWRYRNGSMIPVALTEITRVDIDKEVSINYLESIVDRYNERDFQGKATRYLANKLGIPAFIILYKQGCTDFWIYDFTKNSWIGSLSQEDMGKFIECL